MWIFCCPDTGFNISLLLLGVCFASTLHKLETEWPVSFTLVDVGLCLMGSPMFQGILVLTGEENHH